MRSLVPTHVRNPRNGDSTDRALRPLAFGPDGLFAGLMDDFWGLGRPAASEGAAALDVVERDDAITVNLEVPGIDPQDLEIELTGRILTISAEKRDAHEESDGRRTYSERRFGSLKRSLKLPCDVDSEGVAAEHRHGVVTITLPKSAAVRPRRIEVKAT